MAGSPFLSVFGAIGRHRGATLGVLIAVLALSIAVLPGLKFDNTLDLMLPADSAAQRMLAFLRDAKFSNKIVISLEYTGEPEGLQELRNATDALEKSLEPPWVTKVMKGISTPDILGDAGFFLRCRPQLLGTEDLAAVEDMLNPESVGEALRRRYLQLLKPEGTFLSQAIRSDPLELGGLIMDRLQVLSSSLGYDVRVEEGRFVSRDGRHTMLVAETSVALTDAAGSRGLLAYLRGKIRALPPSVRASVICGHTHSVSNEDTIKRDLGVILSLASVAFIALYMVYFRDPRGLLIFLIPAFSVVVALAVTSLLFSKLSYFVMAFGPVIAGIADDYGIVAYVACRYGADRAEAVRRVARPVTVGAITTTAIFFAFFFSRIPGYHQLALFCVISIFLSVALALFVLPHFIRKEKNLPAPAFGAETVPASGTGWSRFLIAAFLCLVGAAAVLATRVQFDSDVTRLDGTDASILREEEEFQRVWGRGEQRDALLAVVHEDYERTLEANDELYRASRTLIGTNRFASFASVWPSRRTRAENAANWASFWRSGREEKLRGLLAMQGAASGFATNAFDPFFEGLYTGVEVAEEPESNQVFASLKDRFVQKSNNRFQALTYFPDEPELVHAFAEATRDRDDVYILSRSVMSGILSDAFSVEVVRTSFLAGALIVLTAAIFLRSVKLTLVALVPSLAGVAGLLGLSAALGRSLNVANLISGIVVFGLCIDFGVHMVHSWRAHDSRVSRTAVTFAAATTLMGASVLLFARHPALFSVGLTLVAGVGFGYVAAMWLVPVLCRLLHVGDETV